MRKYPSNGYSLVSLFAGCGGSSLGYKMAGFDIRLAVEWDKKAAAIYQANFPETPVYNDDITGLLEADILQRLNMKPGELDVLDGSPPCQGFSTAGKRRFADQRNELFEEYVRILKATQPRVCIMENVSGLIKGKMRLAFAKMTRAMKDAGYRVSCRLLNAWWYGVPQSRQRLIWIGVRQDSQVNPSHPPPTSRQPVTVNQALFGSYEMDFRSGGYLQEYRNFNGDKPSATLRTTPPYIRLRRGWGPRNLTGIKNEKFSNKWRSTSLPSPTLEKTRPPIVQDAELQMREITIDEAKILQSFPQDFAINDYSYIGNSVPPLMAKAVGQHVAKLLKASEPVRTEMPEQDDGIGLKTG